MGQKIRDMLMYEETLFRDERAFDRDYIPKDFNFRDTQLREIALCLKPGIRGERPLNASIIGPPATGKTTAVKLMFDEIQKMTDKVTCVHINCQIHPAKFTIFSHMHKAVLGHTPPETGVPFTKVYESIFKKLARDGKSLVVALDDLNYLFYENKANEIIYDILRAHEVFPGARTAVFGVLSDVSFDYKLEAKVSSIFKPREIFFQPYTPKEIIDILRDRSKLGFFPGVISDKVLEAVADYAFEHADLRVGIEVLRISALIAESDASRTIKIRHMEKAYSKSKSRNLKSLLSSLNKEEMELVNALTKGETNSGELYGLLKEKMSSYSRFYRALDKLESMKLIDTTPLKKGRRGRSRRIALRYTEKEVSKALAT
ncbi:MAG: ORC1-type DNA replication protein [Candidatus Hydrothermarchaeales archaeon]